MGELVTAFLVFGAFVGLSLTLVLAAVGVLTYAWDNKFAGRKRAVVAWGLTALTILACCSASIMFPVLMHNLMLFRLERSLYSYPFPPNTSLVSRQSTIRPNTGNGDYCIFLVRQTMVTTLNEKEISSYYSNVEVPGVSGYTSRIWADFYEVLSQADGLQFTIEINDMVESFFDFRCWAR